MEETKEEKEKAEKLPTSRWLATRKLFFIYIFTPFDEKHQREYIQKEKENKV